VIDCPKILGTVGGVFVQVSVTNREPGQH
jgi:hypothetical protein